MLPVRPNASGADQLAGIEGRMRIIVSDGEQRYEFDYAMRV